MSLLKQASAETARNGDVINYSIRIDVTGAGVNNLVVADTLPANVAFGGFGNSPAGTVSSFNASTFQLTWSLPSPLGSGTYLLTYSTQINHFVSAGTELINQASLVYSGIPNPLSSSATVKTIGQYTVLISVFNGSGELVKQLLSQDFSDAVNDIQLKPGNIITTLHGVNHQIDLYYQGVLLTSWDGTTANGDPAANGDYHIMAESVDSMGSVKSVTRSVVVNRSLFKSIILIYNQAGEIVKHLFAYVDDPGQNQVTGVTLSSSVISPTLGPKPGGVPTQLSVVLSNGTTVVWDGRTDNGSLAVNGQYFVEVHTVDGLGGQTVVTEKVAVISSEDSGLGLVSAWPNLLEKGVSQTTLKSNSSLNLNLAVSLYTVAGELVKNIPQTPGANQATLDLSKMASGLYIAAVNLTDSSGRWVGRQFLKIMVRK